MRGGMILAAGLSSRMGRYKGTLPIGDTTFVRRIISQMREADAGKIVVVTGYRHAEMEEHLSDLDIICVYNEMYYENQMLDSVKLGLYALSGCCEEIFLIPVDMPLVTSAVYREIAETYGDFVRPVYHGKRGHPVLIRKKLFDHILQYKGEGGLKRAIACAGAVCTDVETEEEAVLLDADTPEDYRKMLRKYKCHSA